MQSVSTRDRLLAMLRHRPMTIAELTGSIGLTRNAVLVPLLDLERDGLVRRSAANTRTGLPGKPAQAYEIAPEALERAAPAYRHIAVHMLEALGTPVAIDRPAAMVEIGKSMHRSLAAEIAANAPVGLATATAFLEKQGARIEVIEEGDDTVVISHSCPVGQLVRVDRCICQAIATFLGEASGRPASSECDYADKLTCRFRLGAGTLNAA